MYYNIVREELNNFIKKYQKNPFEFLTEYDLQSYLYFKIFDNFEKKNEKVKIETKAEKNCSVEIFNPTRVIEINPTRREYSASDGFDIAIIDNENNENIKPKLSGYWHQLLKIAIELKYHRSSMGNSVNKLIKGFEKDIIKLTVYRKNNSNFCGIAILFVQNISDDKERELEDEFKNHYEKVNDLSKNLFKNIVSGLIVTKKFIYIKKTYQIVVNNK